MRLALPGSALFHLGAIALIVFAWPGAEPDDSPPAGSVAVSLISVSSFAANATEIVASDASVAALSAGSSVTSVPPAEAPTLTPAEPTPVETRAETVEPVQSPEPATATPTETAEPPPPETAELTPVGTTPPSEPVAQPPAETTEPATAADAEPVAPAESMPLDAVPPIEAQSVLTVASANAVIAATARPVAPQAQAAAAPPPESIAALQPTATLSPDSVTEQRVAPVPATLTIERTNRPIATAPPPARPTPQPTQQRQPRPQPPAPSQAGSGGNAAADSVASHGGARQQSDAGAGGEAAAARYTSQVLSAVRRALRRVNGARGEVLMRFTVNAGGQLTSVSVRRSSGNAAIDAAGTATVQRASFPPIPPQTGRSNWTFDIPLAFGG